MTRTIFRNTLLVGLLVLLLCMLLFLGLQHTHGRNDLYDALKQEAEYVKEGIALSGTEYLEQLDNNNRITWIGADGTALFDTMEQEAGLVKDSPEIQSAFAQGEGRGIRKSEATGVNTMYYALLLKDGTVIRLSRPAKTILNTMAEVSPVLWVLVIVVIISSVLAFRAARMIVRPINEIDLDHPDMDAYPEIRPLLDKIQEQKLTIQEEAAQHESMRREFSANVSAELKTPLTSISGLAQIMSEGVVPAEKVQEYSTEIFKESQRLTALIDDIIALSKLDEEAIGPVQEDIDLYDLAAEVVHDLTGEAEQKHISLDIRGDHAHISGVNRLLYEMISNLCNNAIKYNYPGGRVDLLVEERQDCVRLQVADTGIGISQEHQDRVFERFYRVDKSHSREVGGTGLGLSIVKHGAQYHNAQIRLDSKPGEGTCVTIDFPKKEADA